LPLFLQVKEENQDGNGLTRFSWKRTVKAEVVVGLDREDCI